MSAIDYISCVNWLLVSLAAVLLLSCEKAGEAQLFTISVEAPGLMQTRSADPPDESTISDLNLFVFSEDGFLEEFRYLSSRTLEKNGGRISIQVPLVRGIRASIACCANFGYEIKGISTLMELSAYRYNLAYPDEYSRGIPMSALVTKVWSTDDDSVTIPLERIMAKISVSMDRSALDNGVRLSVKGVTIGNCPRSASVIGPSSVQGALDVFAKGFVKSFSQVDAMNKETSPGRSGEVSVYMLENMMGDLLEDTVDDTGKLVSGAVAQSCSYISVECEYVSKELNTRPGEYLIYRFYLGEENWNFDIERNTHYHFVVQPYGDGLGGSGWRIDKSALE